MPITLELPDDIAIYLMTSILGQITKNQPHVAVPSSAPSSSGRSRSLRYKRKGYTYNPRAKVREWVANRKMNSHFFGRVIVGATGMSKASVRRGLDDLVKEGVVQKVAPGQYVKAKAVGVAL